MCEEGAAKAPVANAQDKEAVEQANMMVEFWKRAAPSGRCKRAEITALLPQASGEGDIDREEFLACVFKKRPGTPTLLACALRSRATYLWAAADQAPPSSMGLVWQYGSGPPTDQSSAAPDEGIWQDILVKFGSAPSPLSRAAQHFMDTINAGMDPNSVVFPPMRLRGKALPRPASGRKAGVTCQDEVPFAFLPDVSDKYVCSNECEREAVELMLAGRAQSPDDLRLTICSGKPMDMSLTSWPMKPHGVIAADQCTDEQLVILEQRSKRGPLSARALRKRRKGVRPQFFQEIRPELEREAALLAVRARWANDRAVEARMQDELAERGAACVAWPVVGERRWPAQPTAWKRQCEWFKRWRSQPRLAPGSHRLERSNSISSLCSWQAVSEISWDEVESRASEGSWQDLLDEQMPVVFAAEQQVGVCKKDIQELKSMMCPPGGVVLTVEVLCVLLEIPPVKKNGVADYWEAACKHLLCDTCLLDRLNALQHYLPGRVLKAVAPYISREDFAPDAIKSSSKAAYGLCVFIREIYKMHCLRQVASEKAQEELARKPVSDLLQEVRVALSCVSKSSLQELKSLCKPPRGVDLVCISLLHLFAGINSSVELTKKGNVKEASWKAVQKLMSNPAQMLQELTMFPDAIDSGKVPRQNVERARNIKNGMGNNFTAEAMYAKSVAAASLCTWVTHIIAYYDASGAQHPSPRAIHEAAKPKRANIGLLSKADIVELKAFAKPPKEVKEVLAAACMLLTGEDMPDWTACQHTINDPGFLDKLITFDARSVSVETSAVVKAITEKPFFDIDMLASKSLAVVGLAKWVLRAVDGCTVSSGEAWGTNAA